MQFGYFGTFFSENRCVPKEMCWLIKRSQPKGKRKTKQVKQATRQGFANVPQDLLLVVEFIPNSK